MENTSFLYVDALAGSGKTYQAINWAIGKAHIDHQKTVIIFKSIVLMDQAYKDANDFKIKRNAPVQITKINSETGKVSRHGGRASNVNARIVLHLKGAQYGIGELLFITEAAFLQIPHWHNRWQWHCICDEIPSVISQETLNLQKHFNMLTQYLSLKQSTASHSLVSVGNDPKGVLASYSKDKKLDDIDAYFAKLASQIVSDNHDVFVLDESYYRVLNKNSLNSHFKLDFYSILKPSIFGSGKIIGTEDDGLKDRFASVTIMGACFKDSLLYHFWCKDKVVFEPHDDICNRLRFKQHGCGSRLEIEYLFSGSWSKRKRDTSLKINSEELTNLEIMMTAAKEQFHGNDFVYMVNKDAEFDVKQIMSKIGGEQLPNSPYGLNCFQNINQVIIFSALNTTPALGAFLKAKGVSQSQVKDSLYHQACYQAVMRTSLRDTTAVSPVKIIVADLPCAEYLQDLFKGAKIGGLLDVTPDMSGQNRCGRPSKSNKLSRADIERRSRARKKKIRELHSNILAGIKPDMLEIEELEAEGRSDNAEIEQLKVLISSNYSCFSDNPASLNMPIFKSIYSSKPDAYFSVDINNCESFMQELASLAKTKSKTKFDNVLACTTNFDPELSKETDRGKENITHVWGVWLDIDGGNMPSDHIPNLFPKLRMAVFNSWSAGNYRIFMPTTDYMSTATYEEVMRTIVEKIENSAPDWEIKNATKHGCRPRNFVSVKTARKGNDQDRPVHGIDFSKLNASSMFYLPTQCGSSPSSSFFIDYNEKGREPLDPNLFTENLTLTDEELEQEYHAIGFNVVATPSIYAEVQKDDSTIGHQSQHVHDGITQKVIDEAIAEYRSVIDGTGRHRAFYLAIRKIHYIGNVPINHLRSYMMQCDYDGHQQKRKRFDGIIKSLQSGKYAPKHMTRPLQVKSASKQKGTV